VFTATIGVGCALAAPLLVAACSDGEETPTRLLDAAPPPPPGPCVVTKSAASFCDGGPSSLVVDAGSPPSDAAVDAADPSDAGSADASDAQAPGSGAPDLSENRCLITEDTSITCPSHAGGITVGEGKNGSTDILVSQLGLARYASPTNASLVNDPNAHVSHVHVERGSAGTVTLDPVPPFDAEKNPAAGSVGILPASGSRDASLVFFQTSGETSAFQTGPLAGGALSAPFGVPVPVPGQPSFLALPSGEGIWVAQPRGPNGPNGQPLLVVRGLPDAPRLVTTGVAPQFFVTTTSPSGEPAGLFSDGKVVRLLEGETFATEKWSREITRGANTPFFDLAYVGGVPAIMSRTGTDGDIDVRFADTAPEAPSAKLGESFSTCPRASYLGITCDACPVDRSCETGEDQVGSARLFTRGGRLFAAFLATDVRRRMGYARSVIPIIGVGCTCTIEEREKKEFADSLVVVEIVRQPDARPTIVEWMRVPLFKARTTGFVSITPRSDGDLDVLVGAGLHRFEEALQKLPEKPTPYRLLRVSTGL
jgi:hypothetical protein